MLTINFPFVSLLLSLFFLISCSRQVHQWKMDTIKADCPQVTYAKAYLMPCNPFNGVEAELLYSGTDVQFFLNAFTLQFSDSDSDGSTEVILDIEDQKYSFWAERLEGGSVCFYPTKQKRRSFLLY